MAPVGQKKQQQQKKKQKKPDKQTNKQKKKTKKPATVTIFEGNDYVTLIVNTFSLIF